MKRRDFLLFSPAAALAAAGCGTLVTSEPDPATSYEVRIVRKGLPTTKYVAGPTYKEGEAFDSLHIEERTLLPSDHSDVLRGWEEVLALKLLGWREESLGLLVGISDINGPKPVHAVLLDELGDCAQLLLDSTTNFISLPTGGPPLLSDLRGQPDRLLPCSGVRRS